MPTYPWLEEKKAQVKAQKQVNPRSYYAPGARERFLSMYTGAGPDGIVQPMNPTGIIQTNRGPRTLDEGERLNVGPGGQFQVIPAEAMGGQEQLARMAGRTGMPRYATGFNFIPRPSSADVTPHVLPEITAPSAEVGQGHLPSPITAPEQGHLPPAITVPEQGHLPPAITPGSTVREVEEGHLPPAITAPEQGNLPPTIYTQAAREYAARTGISLDAAQRAINAGQAGPTEIAEGTPAPPMMEEEKPGAAGRQSSTGLSLLRHQALSGSNAMNIAGRQATEDLTARQAVERAVLGQESAMGNLPEGTAAARLARLRAEQAGELSDIEAKYGIAKAQGMEAAIPELINAERTEKNDQEQKAWDDFLRSAEYGDDATVASAYEKYFGRPISDNAMVGNIRDYARRTREQAVEGGDLALQAQRLNLSTATFESANNLIGAGYDLPTINSLDLNKDGVKDFNLTPEQYDAIRAYTPAGMTDWDRQSKAFNMLIASQDPANITKAAEIFGDMFPGVSFDVGQLITDVGGERFADGMADMATLATKYKTWDEAKAAAEGIGALAKLGGDETAAKQMFESLKVNSIDDGWNAIEESSWYQDMVNSTDPTVQQKARDIADFYTAGFTGELLFDMTPEYTVQDASGKTIQSFTDASKAQDLIDKHSGYKMITTKKFTMKSMTGATTVVNVGAGGNNQNPDLVDSATWAAMGEDEKWNKFEAKIPAQTKASQGYDEEATYRAWVKAGMPQIWGSGLAGLPQSYRNEVSIPYESFSAWDKKNAVAPDIIAGDVVNLTGENGFMVQGDNQLITGKLKVEAFDPTDITKTILTIEDPAAVTYEPISGGQSAATKYPAGTKFKIVRKYTRSTESGPDTSGPWVLALEKIVD